jgi:tripartite ATP-independent transporter DctP family solute receptor
MFGKKILVAGLCLVMAAGVLTAGCGSKDSKQKADAGKTLNFRLAESHPTDYPTTQGDRKFAELVKERSNGRINIKVFDSSQLGEEKAVIEQVQLGSIDFTRVSSSPLGEFNKSMSVFSLPYIFDSSEHMWKFLNSDFAQKMLDNMQSSKFVGLSYMDGGARSFYTKNPVKSPADLKGMKIRVMQSKMNMDLMEALGASATPMPYGEVFSALQTGVIDGAENNAPSFLTANHFQAVKNYTLDAHQRIPEVLMASKATWDKLSPEDQKLIKQAAKDATEFQKEAWAKFEKEALDKVIAGGAIVTEVKDVKPWQDAVKSVIDKYRPDFKEELDAIAAARK